MPWVALALLGGLVGLDATGFPQIMISRPLVVGTLTGLAMGRPAAGLLVGGALEIFSLVTLPVGAARYPEAGNGALAATAAYVGAAGYGMDAPLLLLAIVFGLAWERAAGASVVLQRRENERLVAGEAELPDLDPHAIERRHIGAMAMDFARGAVVAVVGAAVGGLLLRVLGGYWALGSGAALGILVVAASAMVGAILPMFGGWGERRIAFAIGVTCGLLTLLLA